MTALVPLAVALPLVAAAALTAFGHFMHPRADDLVAIAVAAAMTVIAVLLVFRSSRHDLVYWFGAWSPRHGIGIGVSFTVDPLGAGIAALIGVLATASLVFAWRYFDDVGTLFHVLFLIFVGAMTGFALTGDLFNMFVWFELMSVSAYALCGYLVEQPRVLQGALNFAITNSIGALMVLAGIALLYGRTGALNLAELGKALAGRPADGLVIVAFVLLVVGFLVKAGAVPFHFWLSDAYAVAPTPVAVLFAGVLSDLGFHAIARIYWDVFSGPVGAHPGAVRGLLIGIGVLTALVGGVMCFLQADLKRLMAFLTIAHGGIFLVGVGLLTPGGLAGSTLYLIADGLLKGALFLAIGIVLVRLHSGDELWLRGKGRSLVPSGIVFCACGLGLAALPPFGPFLAKSLIEESAVRLGYGWLPPLLTLATILTGAAVLRATGRIFLGLGPGDDPLLTRQTGLPDDEERGGPRRRSTVLLVPAVTLTVLGLALSFVPQIADRSTHHAARFEDRTGYVAEVLAGKEQAPLPRAAAHHPTTGSWLYGAASALGALGLAGVALRPRRRSLVVAPIRVLKAFHSGAIGDYVTWLTVGTATFGGLAALLLR